MKSLKAFFKRKLEKTVTVRFLLKTVMFTTFIVTAGSMYFSLTYVPNMVQAATDWFTYEAEYVAPQATEAPVPESGDRLDKYYEEFYNSNAQKFEELRRTDAKSKAIEKLEAELEEEKEQLRESELLL